MKVTHVPDLFACKAYYLILFSLINVKTITIITNNTSSITATVSLIFSDIIQIGMSSMPAIRMTVHYLLQRPLAPHGSTRPLPDTGSPSSPDSTLPPCFGMIAVDIM